MPVIWLQLILSSSIICTCIPTLKRVLAELQTGMMAGAVSDFFEQSVSGHTNSGDRSASKSDNAVGQGSGSGSASRSPIRKDSLDIERVDSQKSLRENDVVRTINYEAFYEGPGSSRASSSHKDVSDSPSIYSQGGS
jgi:hypothetical protein